MNIERRNNEIIIRLPDTLDVDRLQRLINYLVHQETTAKSQATQEQVDELANEVNAGWWERNKARFSQG